VGAVGGAPPPQQRRPPPLPAAPAKAYIATGDLPSSESEEEEREKVTRKVRLLTIEGQRTAKDDQKARKKEIANAQRLAAMKEGAMQDDQDAFTVRLARAAESAAGDAAAAGARDVKIEGLSVSARGKVLLENTSFTIVAGRRYGLVGPNGKGKSTLLKLLGWRKIPVPEYIDVLMVEQEVVGDSTPALQAVVAADVTLMAMRAEAESLKEYLDVAAAAEEAGNAVPDAPAPLWTPPAGEAGAAEEEQDASTRLGTVYEALANHGGSGAEARAAKILHGLGFTEGMQGRPTASFSGGWRMRISLARALYVQPTLLLLGAYRTSCCA
jgi:ATP-binding cassette subfamily F protein 1